MYIYIYTHTHLITFMPSSSLHKIRLRTRTSGTYLLRQASSVCDLLEMNELLLLNTCLLRNFRESKDI